VPATSTQRVGELFERVTGAIEREAGEGCWLANLWFEEGMRVEADTGASGPAETPQKIKESERWSEASVSLQYEPRPGEVGFACAPICMSGDFDAAALLARATASARVMEPDPALALPETLGSSPKANLLLNDGGWKTLSAEKGLALAGELGAVVRSFSVDIDSVRKPTFEGVREQRLVVLGGADGIRTIGWSGSDYALQVEAAARRGEDRESGWAVGQSRVASELDPSAVGVDAGRRTVELLGGGEVPTGRFDVVLDWRVTAQILELLAPSLIGESHLKKTTFLLGCVGERVFSDKITLVDDGLLAGGPDTQPVDEEGTPRRRTVCVNEGVLERLLYDRASAFRAGAKSTGNGSGSPGGPPTAAVTNLVMTAGERSPAELVGALTKGLWVREVMGLHTADTVSGDFSVGVSGLWVEEGEVTGPVNGGAISGNLRDLLTGVTEVGGDLNFLGSVAAPSVLVEGVELAGEG
jgi:PmbA protein